MDEDTDEEMDTGNTDPLKMTYRELQKACKDAGLPARGKTSLLREMLLAFNRDPDAARQAYCSEKTKKNTDDWIDWRHSDAREILIEDMEPRGWLYCVDGENDEEDIWIVYNTYRESEESREAFRDVPFEQFKEKFYDAVGQAAKRRARSAKEEEWLEHDRRLHPRETHNQRGEPVFDLDTDAKVQLREDVKNKLHKRLKPMELQWLREVYQKYSLDIFRHRIYQEIRRQKYLNYLEKKRIEKKESRKASRKTKSNSD